MVKLRFQSKPRSEDEERVEALDILFEFLRWLAVLGSQEGGENQRTFDQPRPKL